VSVDQVKTVTVGGRRLRVAIRPGTGGGPPLVLCNGIGAPFEVLKPFVDALDPALDVVRFDVPGVGGSPMPRLPYTFHQLASLIGKMLRALGHDRFDALGISWGGALAQQIAFQNPRRCRRLVLVSTATGWVMVPARPRVLARMATPRRHRDAAYARQVAGDIYGGSLRSHPELVEQLMFAHDRPESRRSYLYQLAAGAGWTSLPWLPLIRQETLILAGDDDPIVPLANARIMARLLPSARLHVYHDGHLGLITRADQLASVVAEFLLDPTSTRPNPA
jgi:poly(3-hydroxyalkanoate) depolymerase